VEISLDDVPGRRVCHLITKDFPGPFTQSHAATGISPFGAAIFQVNLYKYFYPAEQRPKGFQYRGISSLGPQAQQGSFALEQAAQHTGEWKRSNDGAAQGRGSRPQVFRQRGLSVWPGSWSRSSLSGRRTPEDAPCDICHSESERIRLEAGRRQGTLRRNLPPRGAKAPNSARSALRKPAHNCQSESQKADRRQYVQDVSDGIGMRIPQRFLSCDPQPHECIPPPDTKPARLSAAG
jgi:hypothetical protein